MFDLETTKKLMHDSVAHAVKTFSSLRVGAVSINFLDEVMIEVYGMEMPMKQVGTVSVFDNFTLLVSPFDKSNGKYIVKAIQEANLGVGVIADGNNVKVTMPKVTEERRKEMVKILKGYAEDAKVSIRNVRRDAMDKIKKLEKEKMISEDQMKRDENEVQKMTDNSISEIEKHFVEHEKRIMKV
ncbi:MAG: hypothetical protein RL208_697 [Pseudomonadota bacterium]|jgi:ribosome recycling factor